MQNQYGKGKLTERIIPMLCLIFTGTLLFAQTGMAQRKTASVINPAQFHQPVVSVHFVKDPLPEVLHELARKVQVGISYKTNILPSKLVTYQAKKTNIYDVLHAVLKGTGLYATLSASRKVIMIKKRALPKATKQQSTVSGTVTEAKTGKTLPGVNIVVQGTNSGTYTDGNGHYELSVESLQDTLTFSFVGYQQRTVPMKGRTSINVKMKATTAQLQNVIVTGFGKESKAQTTGSSSTVDVSSDIENTPVSNVGQALQGSVAGTDVRFNSGSPGSPVSFNIRGVSSINAGGKPLIVLNGNQIESGAVGGFQGLRATSSQGILSSLNPNDIESVSILKGPVATSQYGAKGSNGVIVITTKSGTSGQTQYSANYQVGTVSLATSYPEMVNAKQAAMLYREGKINALELQNKPTPKPEDIPIPGGWDGHSNTDWTDLVMRDHPTTQHFNLSASGGSQTATYYGSLSYQDEKSVFIGGKFKRFSGTFNFKYNFSDHFNITNHFTLSHSKQDGITEGAGNFDSPVAAPVFLSATTPAYNKDGSLNLNISGFYNPLYTTKNDLSRFQNDRLDNNTEVNLDLLENLSFIGKLGIDYIGTLNKHYNNPIHGRGEKTNGYDQDGYTRIFRGSFNYGLKYIWNINDDNTINARLFGTTKLYHYNNLIAAGQSFAANNLKYLASSSTPVLATSSVTDGKTVSFLAKIHYNYKDKFFFDGNVRQEANSRFANNFRWGTFYGVGGAWLISSEDFLRDNNVISKLKVKSDFGITGNNDIGRNQYQSLLRYSANYNNNGGIAPIQLGNKSLTWEKKRTVEAGLSFGFFERINGELNVYHSKTYDLLYNIPISRTTGFSSQLSNVGSLVNKGVEVSINADVIKAKDFQLNLNGNFTYNTNKITSLPKDASGNPLKITTAYKRIAAVGHPVGEFYLKTYAGVNPKNGKPLWKLNDGSGGVTSDLEKANRAYQGANGRPTHYGSVGLRINYKGFFANAKLYGSFGNKVYSGIWAYYYQADGQFSPPTFTSTATQLKRWQKPGDQTDVPRRIAGGNNQSNARGTSRYLYDGAYLRLRTVRIGYNFSDSLLKNAGLRGIKIYLLGQNVWTHKFDSDLIWDPQVGNSGEYSLYNQVQKSYNVGIQIQF